MTKVELTFEQISHLAEYLRGTTHSLDDGLAVLSETYGIEVNQDNIHIDSLYGLDDLVFNCVQCGWWYEMHELSEEADDEFHCEGCDEE